MLALQARASLIPHEYQDTVDHVSQPQRPGKPRTPGGVQCGGASDHRQLQEQTQRSGHRYRSGRSHERAPEDRGCERGADTQHSLRDRSGSGFEAPVTEGGQGTQLQKKAQDQVGTFEYRHAGLLTHTGGSLCRRTAPREQRRSQPHESCAGDRRAQDVDDRRGRTEEIPRSEHDVTDDQEESGPSWEHASPHRSRAEQDESEEERKATQKGKRAREAPPSAASTFAPEAPAISTKTTPETSVVPATPSTIPRIPGTPLRSAWAAYSATRAKTRSTWAVSTELAPGTVLYTGSPPRFRTWPTNSGMPAAALASPPPARMRFDESKVISLLARR